MSCTWREELAYRFAEGSLEPQQKREFTDHLSDCPICQSRVAEAEGLENVLKSGITQLAAPPTLAARVAGMVAAERESKPRFAWPTLLRRRGLVTALTSLALAVVLLVVAGGPAGVVAMVERALLYIPGMGISAVDQGNLVSTGSVVVHEGDAVLTVESLLSSGDNTTVKFNVTGLPGGKEGWADHDPNDRPEPPYLRDAEGRQYTQISGYQGVGGGAEAGTQISGGAYFPALPSDLRSVDLVMPMNYLVPPTVLPGSDTKEWVAHIELAPPAQSGLTQAMPQAASATTQGINLQVKASTVESGRTVVLVEGEASGPARVVSLVANGGNSKEDLVLRDNLGRTYEQIPEGSGGSFGAKELSKSLYFAPLGPGASDLTLTVRTVMVLEDGEAEVTIPLAG
ncbi:MAG: hypothetical protein ACYC1C_04810, partial [Chloroflexota bacterium]